MHDPEDPALHVPGPVSTVIAPLAQHVPEPVALVIAQPVALVIAQPALHMPDPVALVGGQTVKQTTRVIPRLPQSAKRALTKTVCRDFNSINGCQRKGGCN